MDNHVLFEMHIMSWNMLMSFAFMYPNINATNSYFYLRILC